MATVDLTVPVTPATAERWRDPAERARLGALLNVVGAPGVTEAEIAEAVRLFAASPAKRHQALAEAVADLRRAATETGLTPEEVEAELAAWKRERAAARRRS
jgi:hypothetical protein